jgi:molybdopterin-guanine dinucleotide biosynthesis protein A
LKPAPALVTGIVLCGGRASRMDGRDKGLVLLQGRPLVAHVLERFGPQVAEVIINANRHLDAYRRFGPVVIEDDMEGYPGPLAGIRCGLAHAAHALIATAPCDAPTLPTDLVARLIGTLMEQDAPAAVASCNGRIQPVFALYRRETLPALDTFLATGARKVEEWQRQLGAVHEDFGDTEAAFANINTPEDLARAERGG